MPKGIVVKRSDRMDVVRVKAIARKTLSKEQRAVLEAVEETFHAVFKAEIEKAWPFSYAIWGPSPIKDFLPAQAAFKRYGVIPEDIKNIT